MQANIHDNLHYKTTFTFFQIDTLEENKNT